MDNSLRQWLYQNPEIEIFHMAKIFLKIVELVLSKPEHDHTHNYLSPDNILFDPKAESMGFISSYTTKDDYCSPETFEKGKFSYESNLYGLGIILDELERGSTYWAEKDFNRLSFEEFIKVNESGVIPLGDSQFAAVITRLTRISQHSRYLKKNEFKDLIEGNGIFKQYLQKNPLGRDKFNSAFKQPGFNENHQPDGGAGKNSGSKSSDKNEIEDAELLPIEGHEIGIDLGTCNSTVAYYKNGKIEFLKVKNNHIIPSAVFFDAPNRLLYGKMAINKGMQYPRSLLRNFKRSLKEHKAAIPIEFANNEENGDSNKSAYILDPELIFTSSNLFDGVSKDCTIFLPESLKQQIKGRETEGFPAENAKFLEEAIENNRKGIIFEVPDMEEVSEPFVFDEDQDKTNRVKNEVLSMALKRGSDGVFLVSGDYDLRIMVEKINNEKGVGINFLSPDEFNFHKLSLSSSKSGNMYFSGQHASTLFLKYLKDEASRELGPISRAVITVPANFNPMEREATKKAGLEAGFQEVLIQEEPVAASIAYGLDIETNKGNDEDVGKRVLIYDFGGGTFDISIIKIQGNDFVVMETDGDPNLGGEDFTKVLIDDVNERLLDDYNLDMLTREDSGLNDTEFYYNIKRIYDACEKCKLDLSQSSESEMEIDLYVNSGERKVIPIVKTQKNFEEMIKDKINVTKRKLDDVLLRANLRADDIDLVILAGGTSSIPAIRDLVKKYFGKAPYSDKDPATLIASGAAIISNITWGGKDSIDKKIHIFENTFNDFGVSLKGHIFDCIIPMNNELPVKSSREYSLVEDNQKNLVIDCFTREKGKQNAKRTVDEGIHDVGSVTVSDLPPLLRFETVVEVTFELTKEYMLSVSVVLRDKDGKEIKQKSVRINKKGV